VIVSNYLLSVAKVKNHMLPDSKKEKTRLLKMDDLQAELHRIILSRKMITIIFKSPVLVEIDCS
jgi:Lon protease-like protein